MSASPAARRTSQLALSLLLLAGFAGCAVQLRLSVGPSVDTLGGLGFDMKVSGGLGPGTKDSGTTLHANIGGGVMDNGRTATLLGGIELSHMQVFDYRIGVRGGLLYASRRLFLGPDNFGLNGLGLNLAVLGMVNGDYKKKDFVSSFIRTLSTTGTLIGAELQFEYLWGNELDRGVFSLPFTVEFWSMSSSR